MLIAMTIPLTGTQYEIEAGDYRATVTELGAGLRGLRFGDTYLVTGFDPDELPPHGAGQLLTPRPTRGRRRPLRLRGRRPPAGTLGAGQGERDPRPDPLGAVDPHRP